MHVCVECIQYQVKIFIVTLMDTYLLIVKHFSFAVLSRSEEDGIGIEELDAIQTDLETLLAAAGLRLKQLENEKQILVNWADKKDIKGFKSNKVLINIKIPWINKYTLFIQVAKNYPNDWIWWIK